MQRIPPYCTEHEQIRVRLDFSASNILCFNHSAAAHRNSILQIAFPGPIAVNSRQAIIQCRNSSRLQGTATMSSRSKYTNHLLKLLFSALASCALFAIIFACKPLAFLLLLFLQGLGVSIPWQTSGREPIDQTSSNAVIFIFAFVLTLTIYSILLVVMRKRGGTRKRPPHTPDNL